MSGLEDTVLVEVQSIEAYQFQAEPNKHLGARGVGEDGWGDEC